MDKPLTSADGCYICGLVERLVPIQSTKALSLLSFVVLNDNIAGYHKIVQLKLFYSWTPKC